MFARKNNSKKAKLANRNLSSKRKTAFSVESLEDRRLMAANTMVNQAAFVGPIQQPATVATAAPASNNLIFFPVVDTVLEAAWRQVGTSNQQQLVIDGSDQADVITIERFTSDKMKGPTFTVKLERQGVATTQILTIPRGFTLATYESVVVMGRKGDDRVVNLTDRSMGVMAGIGNDVVIGGTGSDNLYGEGGIDSLYGNAGVDYLNGGTENDYLYGQAGADTLNGDEGDDQMWGGADNDTMYGMNGVDTMFGDDGNWNYFTNFADQIFGGEGDDKLDGENGADYILGEGGNDTIWGSFGNDALYGGLGNDTMFGEDGRDRMFGQEGVDTLDGGLMDDYLDGGYESNPGTGLNFADTLFGRAGKDTFARHRATFGINDSDIFADYGSGDTTDNVFHW